MIYWKNNLFKFYKIQSKLTFQIKKNNFIALKQIYQNITQNLNQLNNKKSLFNLNKKLKKNNF